jgi:hypothetical protein
VPSRVLRVIRDSMSVDLASVDHINPYQFALLASSVLRQHSSGLSRYSQRVTGESGRLIATLTRLRSSTRPITRWIVHWVFSSPP